MKECNQQKGIYFNETYAPMGRLEAIRMSLSLSCIMNFKLFQADVKSVFLNYYIQKAVYVDRLWGFINPTIPDHVFKLKKMLYGLK